MSTLRLSKVSEDYLEQIKEYIAEFPADRMRVTYDPDRIPGLDYLEKYNDITEWLSFCDHVSDKLTWYMSVREDDGRIVGFLILRHKLEYDDDDIEFASHIGYSIRPSERRKGYAKEQLRLGLLEARKRGLNSVRIVCRDINIESNKTILANGGIYIDTIHGEESELNVNRYDICVVRDESYTETHSE